MSQPRNHEHPSLEVLLDHAEGLLSGPEAEALVRHLDDCALCRLELKRRDDFSAAEGDAARLAAAQWHEAERQLENSLPQKIWPALDAEGSTGERGPARSPLALAPLRRWWWVPAAAAAVLALAVIQPGKLPLVGWDGGPPAITEGSDPGLDAAPVVRGSGEVATPKITLVQPSGRLATPPDSFVWKGAQDCEHFTLEIFTANLELVFHQAGIPSAARERGQSVTFAAPDSLLGRLVPGETYLWSVQGFLQRQPVAESDNGWFELP